MKKKNLKVLLLANYIPHYRLPILIKLGQIYDLTIAHYGEILDDNLVNFSQTPLNKITFGPFVLYRNNIRKLASRYDVVISLSELRSIQNILLGFVKKRKFSLIFWGIGVSASYKKKFDENRKLDWIRFKLMNKADALIFYSEYPVKRYSDFGINSSKLFVANNTVEVIEKIDIPTNKKHFLFVGTLYKAKKIYDLLEAYLNCFQQKSSFPDLVIVGNGDEFDSISKWISDNNLTNNIKLEGAINEQEKLKNLYKHAIACISPGQAGLTVLNSMAYGVPFITTKDAITGGEIFNIENNINGLFYDGTVEGLSEVMYSLSENPIFVNELSRNSQDYYFKNRTSTQMVDGFKEAIEYAYNRKY